MDPTPFQQEGYNLIGAAFEVYNELGHGLAEEIYQESLELELGDRRVPYDAKRELRTWFKKRRLQKKYVPDLYVYDAVIAELKSVRCLTEDHEGQLMNYMRVAEQPVGYLINFGARGGLEWKRFTVSDLKRFDH